MSQGSPQTSNSLVAEFSATVPKPIEEVFEFLSNMENFGLWFPAVVQIQAADDRPPATVGKHYLETVAVPLKGEQQIVITVVEAQNPTRFVTEGNFAPLLPRMTITLVSQAEQCTKVHWQMQSRNHSLAFRMLLLPLVRAVMSKRAAVGARGLLNNFTTEGTATNAS